MCIESCALVVSKHENLGSIVSSTYCMSEIENCLDLGAECLRNRPSSAAKVPINNQEEVILAAATTIESTLL